MQGAPRPKSESEVESYARNVTVDNCTLIESGKFMWDYGYLWQIVTFPEHYEPVESPVRNRLSRVQFNPVAPVWKSEMDKLGTPEEFPIVP